MPIVPYGGATSIEGHTLAPHGGVCIDMSSMKVNIKLYNQQPCNHNINNDVDELVMNKSKSYSNA